MLLTRSTCRFGTITPALLHLLAVLEEHSRFHNVTIVILSGSDSTRPDSVGEAHHRGEALDLRCTNLHHESERREFLTAVLERLGPAFAGHLAHPGLPAEHIHLQLRRGVTFHPVPVKHHANRFDRI
jgi:hypothetical protein